jgi:hypothetical protein
MIGVTALYPAGILPEWLGLVPPLTLIPRFGGVVGKQLSLFLLFALLPLFNHFHRDRWDQDSGVGYFLFVLFRLLRFSMSVISMAHSHTSILSMVASMVAGDLFG